MSRVGKKATLPLLQEGFMVFTDFDITNWLTGARRVPGLAYHKWFLRTKRSAPSYSQKLSTALLARVSIYQLVWAGGVSVFLAKTN